MSNELAAIVAEMREAAFNELPRRGDQMRRWADRLEAAARPSWLTELIAAGKQLIAANEFGTPDEYCKAEVALTRAALAIPQEGK